MKRSKISWSNLPTELLQPIGNRLETRLDILNFRAVCKDWYRSFSISRISGKNVLSIILPHKLLVPNNSPFLKETKHFYGDKCLITLVLTASSIFLVKPIEDNCKKLPPWLVTVEEVNPGEFCLMKPFSRLTVKDLPDNFPKVLGLGKFDVKEMGRVYSLRFDGICYHKYDDNFEKPNNLVEEDHKVVLLGETRSKIDDVTPVVLYDYGKLAVLNLKNGNLQEVSFKGRRFDDIAVFDGIVYVIDRYGRLYSMDDRFKLLNVIEETLKPGNERKSRLVESCGELYLVRKCLVPRPGSEKKCPGFRVYKLNQEKNSWVEIDSIGDDRILFVTPDCCFFAKTSDFCGWKGNCIVYHNTYSFSSYARPNESDMEPYFEYIYKRYQDKLSIEVFHFQDYEFILVEYLRGYSEVFWPPPQWIFPNTRFPEFTEATMRWSSIMY